jgi:hypothetical protein
VITPTTSAPSRPPQPAVAIAAQPQPEQPRLTLCTDSGQQPPASAGVNRENANDKARRYLAQGRLTIRNYSRTNGVVADVRGDSGLVYRAEFTPEVG